MPKGRPRLSLKVLAASGAMDKNPQRFRDRQEQPDCSDPLGDPPQEWVDRAADSMSFRALVNAWEEISEALAQLGLGTRADRLAVRAACQMKARMDGLSWKTTDFNAYRAMLSELGLTERGRSGMQRARANEDPNDGDFGEFRRKPARRIA